MKFDNFPNLWIVKNTKIVWTKFSSLLHIQKTDGILFHISKLTPEPGPTTLPMLNKVISHLKIYNQYIYLHKLIKLESCQILKSQKLYILLSFLSNRCWKTAMFSQLLFQHNPVLSLNSPKWRPSHASCFWWVVLSFLSASLCSNSQNGQIKTQLP